VRGGRDAPPVGANGAWFSGAVLRPEDGAAGPAAQPDRLTTSDNAQRLGVGNPAAARVAGGASARGRSGVRAGCGCRAGRPGLGAEIASRPPGRIVAVGAPVFPARRLLFQDCLGRSEARRRHAERRTRHVVHAHLDAEFDAARLAPVLAADADLEVLPRRAALGDAGLDDLPDAGLV